ncbi:MAG TPA: exodeoxyribonuclease I [Candidatus Saccharimonadia bacterium]|nr:exodeoxyribonuclease I [Candidatus Saccharimonadia bacterium]
MSSSYLFYDLETSGLNPAEDRIMQFAGIRTDKKLNIIGEPFDFLIKLSSDVLPSIDAILITGITPQMAISNGLSEAEFLDIFHSQIALPETVFVGYNSVAFDDEFIRYMNFRNFYDPYEWHYLDGKRRMDLLDVVRATRALRPSDVNWPVDSKGKPTNSLGAITKANNIEHTTAHSALGDVKALVQVATLICQKQPKLFDYMVKNMSDKTAATKLLSSNKPALYTFGWYPDEFNKTTAVIYIATTQAKSQLVFDLRQSPKNFAEKNEDSLYNDYLNQKSSDLPFPLFNIKSNRCPALAPINVLDKDSQIRIKLDMKTIETNLEIFNKFKSQIIKKAKVVFKKIDDSRQNKNNISVDSNLYQSFIPDQDKLNLKKFRSIPSSEIASGKKYFKDERLNKLILLYKAHNYPRALTSEESTMYESYRNQKLFGGGLDSQLNKFLLKLQELSQLENSSKTQRYILEELKLYAESILPLDI